MRADLSIYLSLPGRARRALEFYRSVFSGDLTLETFGQWDETAPADVADRIIYGVLRTPRGFVIRATDRPLLPPSGGVKGTTAETADQEADATPQAAVCINGEEHELLSSYWQALSAGATVHEPLERRPWGDVNGSLTDAFGVLWIVNIGTSE